MEIFILIAKAILLFGFIYYTFGLGVILFDYKQKVNAIIAAGEGSAKFNVNNCLFLSSLCLTGFITLQWLI